MTSPTLTSPTLESSPTLETGGSIPAGIWAYSLVLDGVSLDLATVLADLTVRHGRSNVTDDVTPSTLQATVLDPPHGFVRAFRTGAPVTFNAATDSAAPFPRFTGYVTDGELSADALTFIAVGPLSRLPLYLIGKVDYPAEVWSARVARLFSEAGLPSLVVVQKDPDFDPMLAARVATPANPVDLLTMLKELVDDVGGTVVDRPDGRVLVQALGYRTFVGAFALDPATVEYAPGWILTLPAANQVTVNYDGGSVYREDAASIALHSPRPEEINTAMSVPGDAAIRADERLARSAIPRWQMPAATSLEPLELEIGRSLTLATLPDSSPYDPWNPALEGWTDTIEGPDWTMVLALSDPVTSGITLPWNQVDAAYLWNTINATVPWSDVLMPGDLVP